MIYIKILILILCIVAANRLNYFVTKKTKLKYWTTINLKRFFHIVEIISITTLIVIVCRILLDDLIYKIVIGCITITLFGLFSWFVLRDYFIGILVKIDNDLKINELIKINNVFGRIRKMSFLSLLFENANKEIQIIPYRKIFTYDITVADDNSDFYRSIIYIRHKRNHLLNIVNEIIIKAILNSPLHAATKLPVIKNINIGLDYFEYEISVFTTNLLYAKQLEEYLNQKFS